MGGPYQTIRVSREKGWAGVILSRPEARNAINDVVARELSEAFRDLGRDGTIRVVTLCGDGASFCAGADIDWMRYIGTLSAAENEADAKALSVMFEMWRDLPCPTICLGHGAALGGGMGFIAGADIAISEVGCKFGFTEVRLGLIPSVISQVVVPAMGPHRARRYFVTGEIFDARKALELGLVSEVVADGEGKRRMESLRQIVCGVGPNAAREAKALLAKYRGSPDSWPTGDDLARTIARLRASPEAGEGLASFLEKRDPSWKSPP